jgi:hypothetical protein
VYVIVLPLPLRVPTLAFPLATPSTVQDKVVVAVPVRVAVKTPVALAFRLIEVGLTITLEPVLGT